MGRIHDRYGSFLWLAAISLASTIGCVLGGAGKTASALMAGIVALCTMPLALPYFYKRVLAGDPLYLYLPAMMGAIVMRVLWDTDLSGVQFAIAIALIASILLMGKATLVLSKEPSRSLLIVMAILACLVVAWYVKFPEFRPKNAVGAGAFYLALLPGIVYFRTRLSLSVYLVCCTAFVVVAFDMRSTAIVCAIVIAALYGTRGTFPKLLFAVTCAAIAGTIFVVVLLRTGIFDNYLASYSSHFDRGLESGRDIIWPMALDQVDRAPYFGSGFQAGKFSFRDDELSAHNQYLQILVQQGWVGLALCFILFALITNKASYIIRGEFARRRFVGIFCGILYANTFEVQFFQNLFYIGIIQWVIISITLYCEPPGNRAIGKIDRTKIDPKGKSAHGLRLVGGPAL